jgi:type IV secretory pathway TrbD component
MKLLASIVRELLGLFVDDGKLAVQVVALIAVVTLLVQQAWIAPGLGVACLVVGCILILAYSLTRAARR